jgi:hypothetical protein
VEIGRGIARYLAQTTRIDTAMTPVRKLCTAMVGRHRPIIRRRIFSAQGTISCAQEIVPKSSRYLDDERRRGHQNRRYVAPVFNLAKLGMGTTTSRDASLLPGTHVPVEKQESTAAHAPVDKAHRQGRQGAADRRERLHGARGKKDNCEQPRS